MKSANVVKCLVIIQRYNASPILDYSQWPLGALARACLESRGFFPMKRWSTKHELRRVMTPEPAKSTEEPKSLRVSPTL